MKKLIAVLFALLLVTACNTRLGGGSAATGDGIDAHGNITPGTQADLEANVGDRVFFAFDSSALSAEGKTTLDRQVAWLKQYPHVDVTVEGHADERGTREYNLALGERRANAAKKYLVQQGVEAKRITVISYGKERPAVVGNTEEAFSQNRRAVTVAEHSHHQSY